MMRKVLLPLFSVAAALLAAYASDAAPADDGQPSPRVVQLSTRSGTPVHQRITLGLGKAAIVEIDADARDVLVSNPDIVDAVVRTPRRVFLMGQKGGQTNAFFFDGAGKQIASIDIRVEKDVTDLAKLIHASFPDSDIRVQAINDTVVLSGSVSSAAESQRAQDIATSFTADPKGGGGSGDIKKVVNVLQIKSSEQVMLKVRVAEMQRTIAKQFGVDLTGAAMMAGVPMIASTSNPYGLLGRALSDLSGAQVGSVCPQAFVPQGSTSTSSVSTTGDNTVTTITNGVASTVQTIATGVPTVTRSVASTVPCVSPNNLQGVVKALEQVGLVHILAEPNLTAVSGETAKFLAGGEFPVPVARDRDGNVTVAFKQFGVGLSFTPVVLSPGRISLQLSTEVSELTNTGAFTLQGSSSSNGLVIPALAVRRAETTVEMPSGGSFAIAGLMQHTTKQVLEAFPGVKDMPILGALFRSRDFANDETELVVLVTAYLVKPTVEAKLQSPTDGFVAPTDLETILLGRLNAVYSNDKNPTTAKAAGGYIVE